MKSGQVSAMTSLQALTENRDVLHNYWFKYCYRKDRTRICGDESPLRKYINFQIPPILFLVYMCVVGFLECLNLWDFSIASQIILTNVIVRAIRTITFLSTTLGPLNPNCRVIFKGASEAGGCGDLLFSGHGVTITLALCYLWTQKLPTVHWSLCVITSLVGIHSMWASAVERFHYTVSEQYKNRTFALLMFSLTHIYYVCFTFISPG
eukprot:m.184883 g.184883  ORF g.184883 m.184883 type:complete len:208 (+) comp13602_c1_seq2:176-799(+)